MKLKCEKHGEYESEDLILFGKTITRTRCPKCIDEYDARERELEKKSLQASYLTRGIEPEFFDATLENYKAENDSERQALDAARKLANREITKLVLLGSNGTGKTHLIDALAKSLNGIRITMFELSARIRAGYNKGLSELDILDELLEYKFIALDEIGRTKGSDAEKNWMSYLIDKCHTRGILLAMVSNRHKAASLPADRKGEAFEMFMDNDVISRLYQQSLIVEVIGRDRRIRDLRRSHTAMAAV